MKKKRTFIKNTIILTATALVLRMIGLFFRVYLTNIIGAEGIGLYQLIFSVYMLAATFASSGISTAVTRLCADELVTGSAKSVKKVLRRSIQLSVAIGAAINLTVYFFSGGIAEVFIGDARATSALKVLSFSLVPMGISACFKGYFMSRRKALTPSVAGLIEQIIRITSVMLLFAKFADKGLKEACFAVLLADTVAEIASCLFIYLCYIKDRTGLSFSNKSASPSKITTAILKIAVPITAGRYLTSFLHTAENLIVPKCLSEFSGAKSSGIEIFGLLKGMALPIIFFPSSLLQSVSTLLIPEISESAAVGNKNAIKADVERTIGITIICSVLIGGWFYLCSQQIALSLYDSPECGVLINVLAPFIPIMYLESVVDGILKGLNQQNATLAYNTIDSVLRISLVLFVVPRFGIDGFLLIMIFSNILTCSLNFIRLLKVTVIKFDIKNWFLKPTASIVIAITFAKHLTLNIQNNIAYIIICVSLITAVYTVLVLVTKALDLDLFVTPKKSI